ncbi:hypothetical protein EXIGLDRAFT_843264 [Exidia glandulosa HHB12029]|uniref:Uncharacterized protein n=1 Tax=Exidia glandulosa HHB12029 TaxID=1314781 RepID=A0A165CSJ4_EXIGL|nr:hypothetical protein EXIGLDRAFT_843264 [Exidia glandulosa HHB12029]
MLDLPFPECDCTDSNDHDMRTVYSIISLCVSTLVVCAWSAVHMDIPRDKTFRNTHGARAAWLVTALIFPEYLAAVAITQRVAAGKLVVLARECLPASTPEPPPLWRRIFDNVSGIVERVVGWCKRRRTRAVPITQTNQAIDLLILANEQPLDYNVPGPGRQHPWTLRHGFYASMGGFALAPTAHSPRRTLLSEDVARIMKASPHRLPDISDDDIGDRSKADAVTKALLCFQMVSFCAACAARLLHRPARLPLTLLEISTLSHCLCAMIAYMVWWEKPHDVCQQTLMIIPDDDSDRDTRSLSGKQHLRSPVAVERSRSPELSVAGAMLNHLTTGAEESDIGLIAIFILPVLYGLPHLLGFWQDFPSEAEEICWRIATVAVVSCTLLIALGIAVARRLDRLSEQLQESFGESPLVVLARYLVLSARAVSRMLFALTSALAVLYVLSNAFLVCESFRQLFNLPKGALQDADAPWAKYIPHFS